MKVHRETGEVPVYELTVAKGGIKMQQLKEGSCTPVDFAFLTQFPPPPLPELPKGQEYCGGVSADGSRWLGTSDTMDGPNVTVEGRGMSLDDFCKIVIGNRLDRPVTNKTGITQRFVFRLKFAPDEPRRNSFRATSQAALLQTCFQMIPRAALRSLQRSRNSSD